MRFISPHLKLSYVIRPADHYIESGIRRTTRALRAEFHTGVFDSAAAQRHYHWTDEERDLVERYLLQHVDFGRKSGFYRQDDPSVPEGLVRPSAAKDEGCVHTSIVDGQPERCGNATVDEGPYCEKHASLLEEPKKGKQKVVA